MTQDEGFVLRKTNYGDTSIIINVFTLNSGYQSFIIKGVRKQKSKIKQNYFQPLTRLELTYRVKNQKGLHYLNQVSPITVYRSIPYDFAKIAQTQFLAEILAKSLMEHDPDPLLYKWLTKNLKAFDAAEQKCTDFHLYALWQWTNLLGIAPEISDKSFFNLTESLFQSEPEASQYILDTEVSAIIKKLMQCTFDDLNELNLNRKTRKEITDAGIIYYHLHLNELPKLKSLIVLEEVMDSMG